jgi:AraC-like DNA-binding protein
LELRRTHLQSAGPGSSEDACTAHPLVIRQLIGEVSRAGLDGDGLCRGLGFALSDIDDPDFLVSYAQTREVMRRAMPLLRQPHLGLDLGANMNLVSLGACLLALMAAPDSQRMFELAVRHMPSVGSFLRTHLHCEPVQTSVLAEDVHGDPETASFLVEHLFASMSRLGRFVVAPSYRPLAVDFVHARPHGALVSYAKLFECPVQFQQASNRLVYASRPERIGTADKVVASLCERLLARRHSSADERSQVERVIVRALRDNLQMPPTMRSIAESIYMSERTLRRRLGSAGVSYASLLDDERRRAALAMMAGGTLPLARVATACGFADVRSLRRALKRWTGKTPSEVRLGHA